MLVLSRNRCEKIKIGDTIDVVVIDIFEGKVILRVRAPTQLCMYWKKSGQSKLESQKEVSSFVFKSGENITLQLDDTIFIGNDIEVTVVNWLPRKVRLGIDAPRSISVHRKEVYDRIRRQEIVTGDFSQARMLRERLLRHNNQTAKAG